MISHRDYVAQREASDTAFHEACERLRPQYEYRKALIEARIAAGLTQKELAQRMGTTQSAIARLEAGERTPTLDTLQRLAKALGISFTITAGEPLVIHRDQDDTTPAHVQ